MRTLTNTAPQGIGNLESHTAIWAQTLFGTVQPGNLGRSCWASVCHRSLASYHSYRLILGHYDCHDTLAVIDTPRSRKCWDDHVVCARNAIMVSWSWLHVDATIFSRLCNGNCSQAEATAWRATLPLYLRIACLCLCGCLALIPPPTRPAINWHHDGSPDAPCGSIVHISWSLFIPAPSTLQGMNLS